jgi:tRNA (guanine-N7-)-methyltransferase
MSRSRPAIDISGHLIDHGRIDVSTPAIEWAGLFGNGNPVELEIGSGKGLFLASAATALPEVNFLGIELSRKYAIAAASRLARLALPNAKIWCGDGRVVLSKLVPPQSLRAVHVYFPDPWWKTRHKKRRVFTAELVRRIAASLQPEGGLRIATDVGEYYGVIRELIDSGGEFREESLPPVVEPEHSLDYLTHFERKYRLEGRPIYRAVYTLAQPASRA